MRVLIHVDRLGEVQESHVVEKSLAVEIGVNDDPVNRDFQVGVVGVILTLADVVLAQTDFEAPGGGADGGRRQGLMMVMVVAMRVESKGGEEEERGRKGTNSGKGLGLRGCWWRGRKEKDEQL